MKEGGNRKREKRKKITKKKKRILTTILSLLNTPNLCLTSRTYAARRDSRTTILGGGLSRETGADRWEMRKKRERKRGDRFSYSRVSTRIPPFSWICRVEFVPPIFRQRKNRPLKFRAWIRRNTLSIQPRLTTDYRAVVVSWRRYTWRARRSDIERALWPDRSDPVTTGRSDDRTRYLFNVPGNQRP